MNSLSIFLFIFLPLRLLKNAFLISVLVASSLTSNSVSLPSEVEEIPEEKPDSEEEIEFDWEELLGVNDEYEYPKANHKGEEFEAPLISKNLPFFANLLFLGI